MTGSFLGIDHILVPKHSIASEQEVKDMLAKYGKTADALPIISIDDPALKDLQVREGDVIKIERNSPVTNKVEAYYRIAKNLED